MPQQIYDLITEDTTRTASDPDGRTWYDVDPDLVYPWTLARIAEALAGGTVPATIRDLYLPRAQALPAEAWALAATPRSQVAEADLPARAEALDLVRLWAQELQHAAVGYAPRGVHITNRPGWRS
jgi:hypothetical protein